MTVLNFNGVKKEIPNCYENLPTSVYQKIIKEWDHHKPVTERNYFQLFCLLSGTEYKSFNAEPENERVIWEAIRWFIQSELSLEPPLPKVLAIGEKIITIPQDPSLVSIGQNVHLIQAIQGTKYLAENLSIAIAVYLTPAGDPKTFMDRALELEKQIGKIPVAIAGPIGFFLLKNALPSGTTFRPKWLPTRINLAGSLRRTWRKWLRSVA